MAVFAAMVGLSYLAAVGPAVLNHQDQRQLATRQAGRDQSPSRTGQQAS